MKIRMVNRPTIINTFVLDTLHQNITRLAIITGKTTGKIENLNGEGGGDSGNGAGCWGI